MSFSEDELEDIERAAYEVDKPIAAYVRHAAVTVARTAKPAKAEA